MSEAPEVTPEAEIATLKGTVSFTRKISDGNYGGCEAFMSVQYDIAQGDTAEDIIATARNAFLQAKAVVFEQLGIDHTLDDSGVVVEVARRAFPGSVVEPAPSGPAPQAAPAGGGSDNPPFAGDTTNPAEKKANKEWATARYATHPHEFYDNRDKKASGQYKQTAPDVKHKSSGIGVWL